MTRDRIESAPFRAEATGQLAGVTPRECWGDMDLAEDELEYENAKPAWAYVDGLLNQVVLLWPHKLRILGATFAAMVGIFLLLLLIPSRYTAVAVLNPSDDSAASGLSLLMGMKSSSASGMASQVGSLLGISSSSEELVQAMQTCRVSDALIRRFDLSRVYDTSTPEKTRKALAAASKLSIDRKSDLIRIAVTDRDPRRAAEIANAYADELGKLNASLASDAGGKEREYFEEQLQLAAQNLDRATRALGDFGKKNAAIDPDAAAKGLADAAGQLQGQIIALHASLKGMRSIYTAQNENVKQTEAQIAELQRQLQNLAGPGAPSASSSGSGPTLTHLWGTAPPYLKLYEDVKVQGAIVATLTEQLEIARMREARKVSGVQLLDPALPPERKSGPHRALLSLAAGILALVGSSAWLLLRAWWDALPNDDPWKSVIQPRLAMLRKEGRRVASSVEHAG